jgi:hypothetical protein
VRGVVTFAKWDKGGHSQEQAVWGESWNEAELERYRPPGLVIVVGPEVNSAVISDRLPEMGKQAALCGLLQRAHKHHSGIIAVIRRRVNPDQSAVNQRAD